MTGRAVEVVRLDVVDSTNAEARRRAEAGASGPLWITARRQTAGRGRRGRAWSSEPGNLAATLLTHTARPPAEAAQSTFVAALAVHELISAFVDPALVRIKWPNDVLLAGHKASGILVESGVQATGGLWLAVGIGVNLVQAPEDVERPATAVARHLRSDLARAPDSDAALDLLIQTFSAWQDRWDQLGFAALRDAWTARAQGLGGPAVARLAHETVEGVAEGLADDGALRLRLPDGSLRLISAGDVFFSTAEA
jgi:BirA family transcriptional regulator, biotin operon repressor / biotin---[acetyl-CoA-carboxylase] ligase